MAKSPFYVGIDGGGTKTALCAVESRTGRLLYAQTADASWREHGVGTIAGRLRDAVDAMLAETGESAAGIAMGLPCYGESAEGDRSLERAVREAFPGVPIYLANDVEVGWAGSLHLAEGVHVVAGTGSIAFGKDAAGNTARSGGWDEFFSDEGSGYWLGRRMMEVFSKQADGRLPRGALHALVREEFSLENDFAFIDRMRGEYLGQRKRVASLQLLAEKAARLGDPCAMALYREAAGELALLARAVWARLSFAEDWAVSCSGGIFKAEELILPPFEAAVSALGGRLCAPLSEPMEGAALLAIEKFDPEALPAVQALLLEKRR